MITGPTGATTRFGTRGRLCWARLTRGSAVTPTGESELLVAALSECHLLIYLSLCSTAGIAVPVRRQRGGHDDRRGSWRTVHRGRAPSAVADEAMVAEAVRLHDAAHDNLLSGELDDRPGPSRAHRRRRLPSCCRTARSAARDVSGQTFFDPPPGVRTVSAAVRRCLSTPAVVRTSGPAASRRLRTRAGRSCSGPDARSLSSDHGWYPPRSSGRDTS